ncbi:hypothetical protein DID75_01580, partial [Candidatus Marinamargulisbacteria bacterium SCGC AG-410-N11]
MYKLVSGLDTDIKDSITVERCYSCLDLCLDWSINDQLRWSFSSFESDFNLFVEDIDSVKGWMFKPMFFKLKDLLSFVYNRSFENGREVSFYLCGSTVTKLLEGNTKAINDIDLMVYGKCEIDDFLMFFWTNWLKPFLDQLAVNHVSDQDYFRFRDFLRFAWFSVQFKLLDSNQYQLFNSTTQPFGHHYSHPQGNIQLGLTHIFYRERVSFDDLAHSFYIHLSKELCDQTLERNGVIVRESFYYHQPKVPFEQFLFCYLNRKRVYFYDQSTFKKTLSYLEKNQLLYHVKPLTVRWLGLRLARYERQGWQILNPIYDYLCFLRIGQDIKQLGNDIERLKRRFQLHYINHYGDNEDGKLLCFRDLVILLDRVKRFDCNGKHICLVKNVLYEIAKQWLFDKDYFDYEALIERNVITWNDQFLKRAFCLQLMQLVNNDWQDPVFLTIYEQDLALLGVMIRDERSLESSDPVAGFINILKHYITDDSRLDLTYEQRLLMVKDALQLVLVNTMGDESLLSISEWQTFLDQSIYLFNDSELETVLLDLLEQEKPIRLLMLYWEFVFGVCKKLSERDSQLVFKQTLFDRMRKPLLVVTNQLVLNCEAGSKPLGRLLLFIIQQQNEFKDNGLDQTLNQTVRNYFNRFNPYETKSSTMSFFSYLCSNTSLTDAISGVFSTLDSFNRTQKKQFRQFLERLEQHKYQWKILDSTRKNIIKVSLREGLFSDQYRQLKLIKINDVQLSFDEKLDLLETMDRFGISDIESLSYLKLVLMIDLYSKPDLLSRDLGLDSVFMKKTMEQGVFADWVAAVNLKDMEQPDCFFMINRYFMSQIKDFKQDIGRVFNDYIEFCFLFLKFTLNAHLMNDDYRKDLIHLVLGLNIDHSLFLTKYFNIEGADIDCIDYLREQTLDRQARNGFYNYLNSSYHHLEFSDVFIESMIIFWREQRYQDCLVDFFGLDVKLHVFKQYFQGMRWVELAEQLNLVSRSFLLQSYIIIDALRSETIIDSFDFDDTLGESECRALLTLILPLKQKQHEGWLLAAFKRWLLKYDHYNLFLTFLDGEERITFRNWLFDQNEFLDLQEHFIYKSGSLFSDQALANDWQFYYNFIGESKDHQLKKSIATYLVIYSGKQVEGKLNKFYLQWKELVLTYFDFNLILDSNQVFHEHYRSFFLLLGQLDFDISLAFLKRFFELSFAHITSHDKFAITVSLFINQKELRISDIDWFFTMVSAKDFNQNFFAENDCFYDRLITFFEQSDPQDCCLLFNRFLGYHFKRLTLDRYHHILHLMDRYLSISLDGDLDCFLEQSILFLRFTWRKKKTFFKSFFSDTRHCFYNRYCRLVLDNCDQISESREFLISICRQLYQYHFCIQLSLENVRLLLDKIIFMDMNFEHIVKTKHMTSLLGLFLMNDRALELVSKPNVKSTLYFLVKARRFSFLSHIITYSSLDLLLTQDANKRSLPFYFIEFNQLDMLKKLRLKGNILDCVDCNGDNLLHYAINYDRFSIVKWLCQYSIDINHINNQQLTPIMKLAQSLSTQHYIKLFLDFESVDLNYSNDKGFSVLHYLVKFENRHMLNYCLLNGGRLDVGNELQGRVLLYAVRHNNVAVVNVLLRFLPELSFDVKHSELIAAISQGNRELVDVIINYHIQQNIPFSCYQEKGPLWILVGLSRTEPKRDAFCFDVFKKILNSLSINDYIPMLEYQNLVLALAAYHKFEWLAFLIQKGYDINCVDATGYGPIHYFVQYPIRKGAIKEFIKLGCQLDLLSSQQESVVSLVIKSNNFRCLPELQEHFGDRLFQLGDTWEGLTPLGFAAKYDAIDCIRFMQIVYDFNLFAFIRNEYSVLDIAVRKSAMDIFRFLGDYWDQFDHNYLLSYATFSGDLEMVKALIGKGVPYNQPFSQQWESCCHFLAAQEGYLDIIQYLFGLGLSLHYKDNCLNTILHIAIYNKKEVVALWLIENMDISDLVAVNQFGVSSLHLICYFGFKNLLS